MPPGRHIPVEDGLAVLERKRKRLSEEVCLEDATTSPSTDARLATAKEKIQPTISESDSTISQVQELVNEVRELKSLVLVQNEAIVELQKTYPLCEKRKNSITPRIVTYRSSLPTQS
jgi:hypothetical protein